MGNMKKRSFMIDDYDLEEGFQRWVLVRAEVFNILIRAVRSEQ
jgi:hypothetical protein